MSWRLIVALAFGVTLVSLASSWYETRTEKDALRSDLERKAGTLGESLAGIAELNLETGDVAGLQQLVKRFSDREHLVGVGVYGPDGAPLTVTPALAMLHGTSKILAGALAHDRAESGYTRNVFRQDYVVAIPLHGFGNRVLGGIVVVHDSSYIRAQILRIWGGAFVRMALQVLVIVALTVLVVRWSLTRPIARVAEWVKALRAGQHPPPPSTGEMDFLLPLTREVVPLARSIERARLAAAAEARLRNAKDSEWTAQRLGAYVRDKLGGGKLYVVSNREPYVHTRRGDRIEVSAPASGLVAALEPVLGACDGTWIAHGSGNADAETVDAHDRLRVPPGEMRYTLRRVWLSQEEEDGYYYWFANEGIWPLCHNAHTRPIFRSADLEQYVRVNRRFADVLAEEVSGEEQPVVLIQDYHFALLPRLVKERLPHARVAIFWHIPWPNPESFEICPWQAQLLDGLLGADLIGFHVRAHCNNFLNTVDHALEARIDWEHFTVTRNEHQAHVLPFPISVEMNGETGHGEERSVEDERAALLEELDLETYWIGAGVDRADYTKGIVERFQAVESFLERNPEQQGKFSFIQLAAQSRTHIKRYADFQAEIESEAARINTRFARGRWRPIVLLLRQHNKDEVQRIYRMAHLLIVTSLHDGMNLVAKEYVAAQKDEQGVLILSRFTGAARELRDAIIVNPYDVNATGEAIAQALRMDAGERTERMRRMRATVKEHNIYWWASNLIGELCDLRVSLNENASASERTPVEV
ncbi:MAG: alpha,alpha-trehalose-phosphate synthase (UDP-forming) [Terracidiphilus sp.]